MKTCHLDHTGDVPAAVMQALPASQAGDLRHRCGFCAYLAGAAMAEQSNKNLRRRVRELEARIDLMGGM